MNENPLRLIEKGTLRADLYWRLCVGQIELPPLRERREDIPLLVEYFIAKYAADVAHHITGVTQNVLDQLMAKPWPGNIRMLENTVLRTMVMQKEDGPISEVFLTHQSQTCRSSMKTSQTNIRRITSLIKHQESR